MIWGGRGVGREHKGSRYNFQAANERDQNATELHTVPTCQPRSADRLGAMVSKGFRGSITNVIEGGARERRPRGEKNPTQGC